MKQKFSSQQNSILSCWVCFQHVGRTLLPEVAFSMRAPCFRQFWQPACVVQVDGEKLSAEAVQAEDVLSGLTKVELLKSRRHKCNLQTVYQSMLGGYGLPSLREPWNTLQNFPHPAQILPNIQPSLAGSLKLPTSASWIPFPLAKMKGVAKSPRP